MTNSIIDRETDLIDSIKQLFLPVIVTVSGSGCSGSGDTSSAIICREMVYDVESRTPDDKWNDEETLSFKYCIEEIEIQEEHGVTRIIQAAKIREVILIGERFEFLFEDKSLKYLADIFHIMRKDRDEFYVFRDGYWEEREEDENHAD